MGVMMAPVDGSGVTPACTAFVSNPRCFSSTLRSGLKAQEADEIDLGQDELQLVALGDERDLPARENFVEPLNRFAFLKERVVVVDERLDLVRRLHRARKQRP